MLRYLLHISFLFLITQNYFCQVRTIKPVKTHPRHTKLGFGGGMTKSVLFLARNVKQNNDAVGYNGIIVYGDNLFRGSFEYTYYKKIDIEPTWYNIKATTIEANIHLLSRFKKTNTYFYPLCGLSYNSFSGYFTGLNDFMYLSTKYKKNEIANTNWIGFNIGVGFEQHIKQVCVFGQYKLRIGKSDFQNPINIMDVCFSFGLRYSLRVPSIYKLFSGTKSRYMLESKDKED